MTTRTSPTATLFPLLLAGLLAGMSFWLEMASRAPAGGVDAKLRHDPDYIIQNFEVRRFDPQGLLQHTVVAEQMRHYPDDDSTIVTAPRITYHREPPTFVSAREALVGSKGEHVTLIDEVSVRRSGIGNKPDTVLTTTRLDVWPDDEVAKSDVPVTITQGKTHVQGSGLSVDNKTSIYMLEGPVQGVFFRKGNTLADIPAAAEVQTPAAPALAPAPALPKPARTTVKPQAKPKTVTKTNSKTKAAPKPKSKTKTPSKPKSNR